jgi:hypothetical protein
VVKGYAGVWGAQRVSQWLLAVLLQLYAWHRSGAGACQSGAILAGWCSVVRWLVGGSAGDPWDQELGVCVTALGDGSGVWLVRQRCARAW